MDVSGKESRMNRYSDVKVNVKPVFVSLVHSDAYEGPCRVGKREELTPDADRRKEQAASGGFVRRLRDNIGNNANILDPVIFEMRDDFVVRETELRKLEPDIFAADLVLVAGGLNQCPAVAIGERYRKPVGLLGWVTSVDVTAHLRSRGLEGYAFLDHDDLNSFLKLLQARKAFRNTRMMIVTQGNSFPSVGVVSSIVDLAGLHDRVGVNHTFVSAYQIIEDMDTLPAEAEQEVETLSDRLIKNARACHMKREDVLPSVRFFITARRFLERYECNAFAIPCFEICATKAMEQRRVMFCLAHTLLKDMGIPSACEADTNVLMAIALLMYLSGKSVFMGNSCEKDRGQNILSICHDVPGLQMKGFDQPPLPYELRNFTVGGWGATVRYDFNRDKGHPVTLARFNPAGDKALVAAGKIVGGENYDHIGCSLVVDVEVNDVVDLFEKEQDFGHHLAMVYGDYTDDIRRLGKLMGLGIEEI
jgi:L-fucose isomerase-like protein